MSFNVARGRENYIQSPTDDIESFFWTFFWAIVKNRIADQRFRRLAEDLENGFRADALLGYMSAGHAGTFGKIVKSWYNSNILELSRTYNTLIDCFDEISNVKGWQSEEEEALYWKAAWFSLALEGLCMSLKVLLEFTEPSRF